MIDMPTVVNAANAGDDFLSDWQPWSGALVLAVQGDWGAATEVVVLFRLTDSNGPIVAPSLAYARLVTFTPDSPSQVQFCHTRDGVMTRFNFEWSWQVIGNDADTDLQLLHTRG